MELKRIACGDIGWEALFSHSSWEHPVDVAAALHNGSAAAFNMVNVPNDGCLTQFPNGRIVEVPASVRNGKLSGTAVPSLPEGIASLCRTVSDVHEKAAEAAVNGDYQAAQQAVEMDPAIPDKKRAFTALDQMLRAHSDLLPQFIQTNL